jgi:hypothetical protein
MNRTYRCLSTAASPALPGTTYDLNRNDAQTQHHVFQVCLSGTSSQRPNAGDGDMPAAAGNLQAGIHFLDLSLGYIIVSDGAGNWRNPYTGAAV